jgi:hypothetical protein
VNARVAAVAVQVTREEVHAVADRCVRLFGDGADWTVPVGYPDSLALCVIDSVQAAGVKYATVLSVVDRYRAYRARSGRNADKDGASSLLETFDELGLEGWMDSIGTRNRTPPRPRAPFKAQAIRQLAGALVDGGIDTTAQLRKAAKRPELLAAVHDSWVRVVGQTPGVTWHYFLILANVPGIKPDALLSKYVAQSLGVPTQLVTRDTALDLLSGVARMLDVSTTLLDYQIWQWQRRANHGRN